MQKNKLIISISAIILMVMLSSCDIFRDCSNFKVKMLDGSLNDCKVCKDQKIGEERCDTKLDWNNNKYDCLNPKNCLELIESKKPFTISEDVPIEQYWNQILLTEYLFKQKYKLNSSGGGNGLLLYSLNNTENAIQCTINNKKNNLSGCCVQGEIIWGQERNISSIKFNKILYQDDCETIIT